MPSDWPSRWKVCSTLWLEAMDSSVAYRPASLDGVEPGHDSIGELVGETDPELAAVIVREQLERLMSTLGVRERQIMYLRFFEELSQSEIAERVGTSQVHVSRIIRRSLERMRATANRAAPDVA